MQVVVETVQQHDRRLRPDTPRRSGGRRDQPRIPCVHGITIRPGCQLPPDRRSVDGNDPYSVSTLWLAVGSPYCQGRGGPRASPKVELGVEAVAGAGCHPNRVHAAAGGRLGSSTTMGPPGAAHDRPGRVAEVVGVMAEPPTISPAEGAAPVQVGLVATKSISHLRALCWCLGCWRAWPRRWAAGSGLYSGRVRQDDAAGRLGPAQPPVGGVLSLDAADSDPARFWRYGRGAGAGATQQCRSRWRCCFAARSRRRFDAVATTVINQLDDPARRGPGHADHGRLSPDRGVGSAQPSPSPARVPTRSPTSSGSGATTSASARIARRVHRIPPPQDGARRPAASDPDDPRAAALREP